MKRQPSQTSPKEEPSSFEDEVLRRMLNTPPQPHKAKSTAAKKKRVRATKGNP